MTLPEIRITAENGVPQCVTPERLMAFLERRNPRLDPRFKGIATFYKYHGEGWRVRWDYAFFQMAVETNFLSYRRPDGRMGDVDPRQNNFAGIGTTGGGVPGDSFPDVGTGVLGQIQHLVVYSGEQVARPVAPRTQLKQEQILLKSRELRRAVRFSDLAGRWAADRKYGTSIDWVAQNFAREYCRGGFEAAAPRVPEPMRPYGLGAGSALPAPAPVPAPVEVLPWAKPRALPRAGGVSSITTGSIEVADNSLPAHPRPDHDARGHAAGAAEPSPVRTIWRRGSPQDTHVSTNETTRRSLEAPGRALSPSGPGDAGHFALFTPPALLAGASPEAGLKAEARFQPPISGLGMAEACHVEAQGAGEQKAVLLRSADGEGVHYIALGVIDGLEDEMSAAYLRSRPDGGEALGTFATGEAALVRARELCPGE